ncbi:MAG: D-alanine--D-alanine ligase [Bacteroidales bacterium]|nr:D-alanine--D-alanine ligase [Bacteroidales bacterium]
MKVALLYGGYSGENEISKKSALNVLSHIDKLKHEVYLVEILPKEWLIKPHNIPIDKNDFSFKKNGEVIHFDVVLMMIHGTPGEDGLLQSYFEMLGIPYTNCSSHVSMLTFHKYYSTLLAKAIGVATAPGLYFPKNSFLNESLILHTLGLPVFIKPATSGSSIGMSKVNEISQLKNAIIRAFEVSEDILVEKALAGIEVTCGAFKEKNKIHVLPPTLIRSKKEFFDYEAKYSQSLAEEITPAPLEKKHIEKIQETTYRLYEYFRCKGVVRIDYIMENDILYFLEINTVPGMSLASIIPKQVEAYGMNMTDFINILINEAFNV